MWRIHLAVDDFESKIGITSTCVENTSRRCQHVHGIRDHLHMCGEYLILGSAMPFSIGSPPHVWRILMKPCINALNAGITSTCVENTHRNHPIQCFLEDHLHMCGEYITVYAVKFLLSGSPPHVWRIPSVLRRSNV